MTDDPSTDEEPQEPSVTPGPYGLSDGVDDGRIVAEVLTEPSPEYQDIHTSIASTRYEVSEDEPQMNAELILAAFNLAHALRNGDRDPTETIRAAARIVEENDEEGEDEERDDVMDEAPWPDEVKAQLAKQPDGQQNVALASTDDNIFLYFGQPMHSLALSKQEAKSLVGQLLNHVRGNV